MRDLWRRPRRTRDAEDAHSHGANDHRGTEPNLSARLVALGKAVAFRQHRSTVTAVSTWASSAQLAGALAPRLQCQHGRRAEKSRRGLLDGCGHPRGSGRVSREFRPGSMAGFMGGYATKSDGKVLPTTFLRGGAQSLMGDSGPRLVHTARREK